MTSYERRCDVMTSHRRPYDVILRHMPAGVFRKHIMPKGRDIQDLPEAYRA